MGGMADPETVIAQGSAHFGCWGKADHHMPGCFIGFADRGDGVAFAGSGLAIYDREAFGAGRPWAMFPQV
jgi:hypothetical protein